LPWALGADFFLRHLLDGDPASNTLSWRWVAGLQTAGKTYAARADNIAKYTGGRFDPKGLAPAHTVTPVGSPDVATPLPVPLSDDFDRTAPTGLLMTEDDLSPGFLFEAGLRPRAGAILLCTKARSPLAVAEPVATFTRALAEDARARWAERAGGIAIFTKPGEVAEWAAQNGLTQLVAPHTPAGPGRSGLDALRRATDLPLKQILRPWDAAALPHATAGFFRFKAKIPALLATL
jgi:deoxyribodipyrimidine photo-lyase